MLSLLVLTVPLTASAAPLAEAGFRVAITNAGAPCESIAQTQAIGTSSSGDALVAVACSDGGRYVVRIHKDNSLSYMTPCSELKSQTGITCFDQR